MAITDEEAAALAEKFGDEHVHIRGKGKTPKRFRGDRNEEDEKTSSKKKKREKGSQRNLVTPVSVVVIKKEGEMTTRTIRQQGTPTRQPTPFGNALYIARQVKSKDDPKGAELKQALKALNDEEIRGLAFKLRNEIMEKAIGGEEYSVSPLFPVAFAAKMAGLAHNTAAVAGIISRNGAEFNDLVGSGLIEIKVVDGQGRKSYHFGHENLKQAAEWFRDNDKLQIAKVLEGHLRRGDEKRAIRQAETAASVGQEPEPEPEPEPKAEEATPKAKKKTRETKTTKAKA